MLYRLECALHDHMEDTHGKSVAQRIDRALGLSVAGVRMVKVFTVDGLSEAQVTQLLEGGVWHDPILQQARLEPMPVLGQADWFLEVGFRPGVTDNEARTARDTAAMVLDIPRESLRVYTALQYRIANDPARPLDREQAERIARGRRRVVRHVQDALSVEV